MESAKISELAISCRFTVKEKQLSLDLCRRHLDAVADRLLRGLVPRWVSGAYPFARGDARPGSIFLLFPVAEDLRSHGRRVVGRIGVEVWRTRHCGVRDRRLVG